MPKFEKALLTGLIISMLLSAVILREGGHTEIAERIAVTSLGERWWGVVFSYPHEVERRKPGEKIRVRFRLWEFCCDEAKNRKG